jgi:hypothetical protein
MTQSVSPSSAMDSHGPWPLDIFVALTRGLVQESGAASGVGGAVPAASG